jgi:hypothetical protein
LKTNLKKFSKEKLKVNFLFLEATQIPSEGTLKEGARDLSAA